MIPSENEDQFSPNSQHKQQQNDSNQKQKDSYKKYAVIDQSKRVLLLKKILSKESTIKEAAKEFGVNFSTAKAILQTYRKEGRIGKKKTRERNKKEKSEPEFSVCSQRKVQSMYDLEREVQIPQRSFSPDLKASDKHITKSILQQQSLLLNRQKNQPQQINSNEEQNAQIALAACQRELEKQKLVNMQLALMIQNYQIHGFQAQAPEVKEEDDKIN
ncbi:unnamed protein product (macronuclear) [Paramecium tetraurelia]|uniref:Insertion element IS150 protein InsJ-like helix-turn-helix domain-containing protein n=1 Tax=Paramecium tetraurelia TaxID=5888 RepID=A0BPG6_PARTE|nr:uncharacterized protein GSPATT00005182001 [Paramecium tetraurelia]CAK60433.1 unnamed protein product [Paramecium tetraurelia]|eukprot:XP_001427831.1 hypothetical protein (macronuclear) [Paramecium tetraurelia strain d4-2]